MLKEWILNIFESNGYSTYLYRGCFDIAAKREKIFLVKVLHNVDAFQKTQAKNIKLLSNNLDAYPLLVGLHTRREKLEKGIIYERFETPVLSPETLEEIITYNIFPSLFRNKGGLYITIDPVKLKRSREAKHLTQKKLADMLNINKKTIYEHEARKGRMDIETARKLEEILGCDLSCDAEFLRNDFTIRGSPGDDFEYEVDSNLRRLGFETDFIKQCPIDVIIKEKIILVSDVENNERSLKRRLTMLKSFTSFIDTPAFVVTEKKMDLEIPVIEKKELEEFESGKELIKAVKTI